MNLRGMFHPGHIVDDGFADAKDTMNLDFKPKFVSYSADMPTKSIGIVVGRQR